MKEYPPCPGCGKENCREFGERCWRNNGCPATPPDRVPITPVDHWPDRCRQTWRPKVAKIDRVWPYKQPAIYWPKDCGQRGRQRSLTRVYFLDY